MKQTLVNCVDFSKLWLSTSHRNVASRSDVALVLGTNMVIMKTRRFLQSLLESWVIILLFHLDFSLHISCRLLGSVLDCPHILV